MENKKNTINNLIRVNLRNSVALKYCELHHCRTTIFYNLRLAALEFQNMKCTLFILKKELPACFSLLLITVSLLLKISVKNTNHNFVKNLVIQKKIKYADF